MHTGHVASGSLHVRVVLSTCLAFIVTSMAAEQDSLQFHEMGLDDRLLKVRQWYRIVPSICGVSRRAASLFSDCAGHSEIRVGTTYPYPGQCPHTSKSSRYWYCMLKYLWPWSKTTTSKIGKLIACTSMGSWSWDHQTEDHQTAMQLETGCWSLISEFILVTPQKALDSTDSSDPFANSSNLNNYNLTTCTLVLQEKGIPLALEGKDILARAKTGSGKTAV